ncbi:cytochrome P450 [Rhodovulum sp. DZ06]|uniref:cytochrome P450 n=1 Tax=Rhodovulum sp. DZ06 TaxID=3425126 RepID=UPI003D33A00C
MTVDTDAAAAEELIAGHIPAAAHPELPDWDVDPYDEDLLRDPFAYYAALRDKGPVVRLSRYGALAVGRFEQTREVFSDHARFLSSRGVGLDDFKLSKPWRPPSIILEVDPPEHTRARRVMAKAMSPLVARALAADFRASADALVEAALGQGRIEAVTEFAEAFPTEVFPRAVGMTDPDRRKLIDYGAMVFNSIGPDNALRRRAGGLLPEIAPWIAASCSRERLTPGGMGDAVYSAADAGEITHEEAGLLVRSFLSAGVDTTVTGIGNALWCFAQNPDQWAALKADPSLVRPAIEEALRLTSPVHTFCRTAGQDTEIAGIPVREGTKILCVLGAANTDPEKWEDPMAFRVDRRPVGHLAFGVGIHGCVGQTVARAELEAVLSALLARVDRIEPDGEAVWRPNNAMRALDRLPLRLVPR